MERQHVAFMLSYQKNRFLGESEQWPEPWPPAILHEKYSMKKKLSPFLLRSFHIVWIPNCPNVWPGWCIIQIAIWLGSGLFASWIEQAWSQPSASNIFWNIRSTYIYTCVKIKTSPLQVLWYFFHNTKNLLLFPLFYFNFFTLQYPCLVSYPICKGSFPLSHILLIIFHYSDSTEICDPPPTPPFMISPPF